MINPNAVHSQLVEAEPGYSVFLGSKVLLKTTMTTYVFSHLVPLEGVYYDPQEGKPMGLAAGIAITGPELLKFLEEYAKTEAKSNDR